MTTSILLALNSWDATVDTKADIALASEPYSTAQDVATACRTFQGELWYDTTAGVPYFQLILGKLPPLQLVKSILVKTAKSVLGVLTANVFFTSFNKRTLSGQIQITNNDGTTATVAFSNLQGVTPWYVSAASPQALGSSTGGP